MKNIERISAILLLFVLSLGVTMAQGSGSQTKKAPKLYYQLNENAFYTEKNNHIILTLKGSDKEHKGKFKFPTNSLYKFEYATNEGLWGGMKELSMDNDVDLNYVADICLRVKQDIRSNYKVFKAPAAGTFFASFILPPFGLACAIPMAATAPKIQNFGLANTDMLHEDIYYQAYLNKAWKKKRRATWLCFGLGTAASAALWTTLYFLVLKDIPGQNYL